MISVPIVNFSLKMIEKVFMPIVSLDTWRNSTIWQDDTEEARVHSQGKVQGMAVDEKTVEG